MFHTQESRGTEKLNGPIKCVRADAWLGDAWYFWYDADDAFFWGNVAKRATLYFDIYYADVNVENVLDTVFHEESYLFWKKQIEKAQKKFAAAGISPTLKALNNYFIEKNIWTKFDGIMFQDIHNSPDYYFVRGFQYKKRIQLAVYNQKIIGNFAHHSTQKCV